MKRRFESTAGRIGAYCGFFLLITFVSGIVIGVANSNLFWGEDNQYGRVDIPGHKVVHLPSGRSQVTVAVALPGRGNETPDLRFPRSLSLTVDPVAGDADVKIRESLGGSVNANDNYDDTQRRAWYVTVSEAGDYKVTARGDFTGYGVNAQIWLGYEPGLVTGWNIWLVALGVAAVGQSAFVVLGTLRRRRRQGGARDYQEDPTSGMPTSTWLPRE
ncbi:MAG TPA: hypothetical protein VGM80_00470 [Gaiellaceae bacterium]